MAPEDSELVKVRGSTGRDLSNVANGLRDVAGGYRDLSREVYRYTFYAMGALRVGSMLVQGALIKGLIGSATAGQDALDRLGAITADASARINELAKTASDVAVRTPHDFASIVQAMEMLYRAGMSLDDVQESIDAVAKMATISGRSLATEAEFIATIMLSFGNTLGENGAAKAADQLAMAARMSRYWFGDLEQALANCMATASALNQTFEGTLATLTAFASKGMSAAQAGTMLNRMLAQMGNPETIKFFKEALEAYGEGAPPLFTAEGLGDIGAIAVAAAEVYKRAIESVPDALKPQAQEILLTTLSQIFGVRGIRGFLALAEVQFQNPATGEVYTGLRAYQEMLKQIKDASASAERALGTTEDYLNRLYGSWQYSRMFLSNMTDTVKRMLGTPIINVLNPIVRLLGEATRAFVEFGGSAEGAGKDVASFISTMLSLGGVLTFVGGATAIVMGMVGIWKGRLMDLGSTMKESLAKGTLASAAIAGGRYTSGQLMEMAPTRLALTGMFGSFLGPLALAGKLVALIAAGFLAWKHDLGGVKDRINPIIDRLKKLQEMTPGETGKSWGERLTKFFSQDTKTGSFLHGIITGMEKVIDVFLRAVFFVGDAAKFVWEKTQPLRDILSGMMNAIAWAAGWGNVERGWENFGQLIGVLMMLSMGSWAISGVTGTIKTIKTIFTKIRGATFLRALVGGGPFFKAIGGMMQGLGIALKKILPETALRLWLWGGGIKRFDLTKIFVAPFKAMAKGIWGFTKSLFNFTAFSYVSGRIKSAGAAICQAFSFVSKVIMTQVIPSFVELGKVIWAKLIAPIVGTISRAATSIWAYTGGALGKGAAGGALAGLLPLLGKVGLILAAIAALGGLGYLVYKLVAGTKEETGYHIQPGGGPLPTNLTRQLPIITPVEPSVSFAPTIILKEGTPREHAEQVLAILREETPRLLKNDKFSEGALAIEATERRGSFS
ncbi:MAG: phage tail tape measure protein [Candidatus Thermoplasmatota archaeon]|nr:phage tail tape measure protein [Candidatus Thermoplasmatota archaeon]